MRRICLEEKILCETVHDKIFMSGRGFDRIVNANIKLVS